jgi:tRNA threonylcarbamoyladenosine biosynthesis protein TsaE
MNGPASTHVESLGLDGIERLAQSMLRHLPTPLVIGLVGTLGAGKTTLVQAIARQSGIDSADVTSPTFTLLQTYRGSITLHHLDAYRIADEDEFLEIGVEELFDDQDAWTLIEWADRVRQVLPAETLWVEITIEDEGRSRSVTFTTSDQRTASALDRVCSETQQPSDP